MRKGKDEKGREGKGREEKMKIRKMRGKAANSRATIAARKTNEPAINTRRTIGEAFDLVTPANQSLGRLIPHCTRSRVPVPLVLLPPTKQCLTAANFRNVHLGKTPFAPKWRPLTDPTRVSASPFFPTVQRFARYSVSLGQRTRVVIAPTSSPARARPTHLCVNYPLLCPSSLLTAFFILLFPPWNSGRPLGNKKQPVRAEWNNQGQSLPRFFSLFFFFFG